MQFTTGTLTACTGGEHLTLPVTINGVTRDFAFTRDDVVAAGPDTMDELRVAILARLRSAKLEAGATTVVQIRNAVSSKTFSV